MVDNWCVFFMASVAYGYSYSKKASSPRPNNNHVIPSVQGETCNLVHHPRVPLTTNLYYHSTLTEVFSPQVFIFVLLYAESTCFWESPRLF